MMMLNIKMIITSEETMAMVLSVGIFLGGLVQFIVGAWECGNTFGATTFTSHGVF